MVTGVKSLKWAGPKTQQARLGAEIKLLKWDRQDQKLTGQAKQNNSGPCTGLGV